MAVLAAAASLSVLVPLYRSSGGGRSQRGQAMAIYRDQLSEVDRDLDRGVIAESEAAAARTEIARRLIRAGGEAASDGGTGRERARRVAIIVAIGMPIAALAFYLVIGSPQLPGEPLAARLSAPPDKQDLPTLVARIEAHLVANPDDGQGWEVLAPVYMRLRRYDDAVKAYGNAARLLGATAQREADLGEAMVSASGGLVTAKARAAFEQAAKLDASAVRPRFYLAVALGQEGKTADAVAAWKALLDGAPDNAPWVAIAQAELAKLQGGASGSGNAAAEAPAGPTTADINAANQMLPADRMKMIEGMVAQLAAKLDANPADSAGWARLIRSYMVLNRPDDAKAALAKARAALAADATALASVNDAAKAAGVPE